MIHEPGREPYTWRLRGPTGELLCVIGPCDFGEALETVLRIADAQQLQLEVAGEDTK